MDIAQYDLNQKLPANALIVDNTVWSRYRQYPVFSRRWFHGRSLLFGAGIAAVAVLSGLGVGLATRSASVGWAVAGIQFAGLAFVAFAGPALATWARHRNLAPAHERAWIVAAIVAGILLSLHLDDVVSDAMQNLVRPAMAELTHQVRAAERTFAARKEAAPFIALINVTVRAVLYSCSEGA